MTNIDESGQRIRNSMATAPKTSEQPLIRQRKMPEWICHECGIRYCNGSTKRYATYHIDTCQCCGAEEIPCTEPRDYGHFKQWPLPDDIDPKPLPRALEDLIQPVLDGFDFDTLHKAMTAVRWQWFDGWGPENVPTVDQLKAKASYLLKLVANPKAESATGTGGLYAFRHSDDEPQYHGLELQFIFERNESYFEDYQ
jgi:hypothetical protein